MLQVIIGLSSMGVEAWEQGYDAKEWLTLLLVAGWVKGKISEVDAPFTIFQQRHLAVRVCDVATLK